MNVTDDELMAYLDGELDAERAETLKALIAERADVARRVAEQQALGERLRRSFDPVLDEAVPPRFGHAIARGRVVDIVSMSRRQPSRSAWASGLSLAAGLILGVLLGPTLSKFANHEPNSVVNGSALTKDSALEKALSHRLVAEQSAADSIRVGVSFVSKGSEYCRTFISDDGGRTVAGVACRSDGSWRIDALQAMQSVGVNAEGYRQAATSLPPLIVEFVNTSIVGDALDANGEESARARGWKAR